jgi:hypothetical protein
MELYKSCPEFWSWITGRILYNVAKDSVKQAWRTISRIMGDFKQQRVINSGCISYSWWSARRTI